MIEEQKQILQITDGSEEKILIQKHEEIQQKEQEQLREETFSNNYLLSRLNKVEEIIQEQQAQTQQANLPYGTPSSSK